MNDIRLDSTPRGLKVPKWMTKTAAFFCAYAVVSLFIFGDISRPILILLHLLITEQLPLPDRIVLISLGTGFIFALSATMAASSLNKRKGLHLPIGAVFISVMMVSSMCTAAKISTSQREEAIKIFEADKIQTHSFWQSLKNHDDFLYTHAVAIKDCEAYIWSYRTMSFHIIPSSISRNVLPKKWAENCDIS